MKVRKLSEFTDKEIAAMMGSLHHNLAGKHDALIAEASYRLVRADGGRMTEAESLCVDEVMTDQHRTREAARVARRSRGIRGAAVAATRRAATVISIR